MKKFNLEVSLDELAILHGGVGAIKRDTRTLPTDMVEYQNIINNLFDKLVDKLLENNNSNNVTTVQEYKDAHIHETDDVCKWVICSCAEGRPYKLEFDNINFNHKIHGATLLPYKLAIDLVGLLENKQVTLKD